MTCPRLCPPPAPSPVGSLRRHLGAWEALPASPFVVGVIRSGFRLSWTTGKPPLCPRPPPSRQPSSEEARRVLQEEVDSLLRKGAVEVLAQVSPGFYGHLFCVPKASGGWRPVLDLSFLNRFLRRVKFRMESNSSIRESIRQNDWGASIDLTPGIASG